jgi:hypothetical protein
MDERVSISAGELMDGAPAMILVDELADLTLRYLDMSGFRTKRILADLPQDRFAEWSGLAIKHSLEVEVLVIGTAILDAWRKTKLVGVRRFAFSHSWSATA